MSTSYSKIIFDIFKILETLKSDGKCVQVNWHYQKDDADNEHGAEGFRIASPFFMIVSHHHLFLLAF